MSKRILVDMDDTIVDTAKGIEEAFKSAFPDVIWNGARTMNDYNKDVDGYVRVILSQPRFFASLKPVNGAIDAIRKLEKLGYDVWFCTSPIREYTFCVPEKFEWIEKHLGFEWTRKIIIAKDKTLIRGRWLIDDKTQLGKETPEWEQIIVDQSYNKNLKGKRLFRWDEIESLLIK